MEEKTAALIVIGDEILRGQVADLNTSYLAKKLYAIGVKLRKVVTIPDSITEIAKELSDLYKNYTTIFTSGGVGPTHDDVTYAGVAESFGLELEKNQELYEIFSNLLPQNSDIVKLYTVPSPCQVIRIKSTEQEFAVINVENVYVLPGSSQYYRRAVDEIVTHIQGGVAKFIDCLELDLCEVDILRFLNPIVEHWKDKVNIGSYPQKRESNFATMITFEGEEKDVLRAKQEFQSCLPRMDSFVSSMAEKIMAKAQTQSHVKHAWEILEECYNRFKADEVFISFNGGKDCTAVLHLTTAFNLIKQIKSPLCLFIIGDTFPEVEDFVKEATRFYKLQTVRKKEPLKRALNEFLNENPKLRACLMGTRKGDPNSEELEPFCKTDSGWPSIMRVNPIVDWSYTQVWKFMLEFNVPYCSLYDKGYSSIGPTRLTTKNPLLQDPENPSMYLPAYALADASSERQGRK